MRFYKSIRTCFVKIYVTALPSISICHNLCGQTLNYPEHVDCGCFAVHDGPSGYAYASRFAFLGIVSMSGPDFLVCNEFGSCFDIDILAGSARHYRQLEFECELHEHGGLNS